MKRFSIAFTLLSAALSLSARAETPQQQKMTTCNALATQRGMKGDERKTFMKDCLSAKSDTESPTLTPQQEKMKQCNSDATGKALKGDARKAFMKDCLSK